MFCPSIHCTFPLLSVQRQALRAALTPNPSPAVRERGDLVGGLGIVERHRHRVAAATLISPLVGAEGGWWEREGASPPSSPAAWERKGAGGKVRAARRCGRPSPPTPLPRCGRGVIIWIGS